jgi:3-hydroxyisobutyrate dehydrogenase
MDKAQRIAFIGTGVMGASMAGHLLNAGHRLTLYTRTKAKADGLLDRHRETAAWADSPAAAAEGCDFAISMVGVPDDVRDTHLGERGTLRAQKLPRVIIDMTTSRPSLAVTIADEARKRGVGSLDAPVSGGDIGARNATLSVMVGGTQEDFDAALPILRTMGKNIVRQGGPGAGQHTKMINQIVVAASMIGTCEGLLYAGHAGLDPLRVIESVGAGAAGSWTINNLGPRIVRRDFEPGFYVEHFIKDLGIALEEAQRMNLDLPGLALAKRLYDHVRSMGLDRKGTQSLMLMMELANARSGAAG